MRHLGRNSDRLRKWAPACALLVAAVAGCSPDMADQPRYDPLEVSDFFEDGMASRPPVPGTVARGQLEDDPHFFRGRINGELASELPMEVDLALLERGRERYDIYCSHCHDRTGIGEGMAVRRGFPAPPSYHIPRLREAPVGQFFDVITNGLGRMPQHGTMIDPADRWAIVAYIRALQLSQHVEADRLSPEDLDALGPGSRQ